MGVPADPGSVADGSYAFGATGEGCDGVEHSDLLKSVARWMQLSLLSGIVVVCALCFALGASSGPPMAAVTPA